MKHKLSLFFSSCVWIFHIFHVHSNKRRTNSFERCVINTTLLWKSFARDIQPINMGWNPQLPPWQGGSLTNSFNIYVSCSFRTLHVNVHKHSKGANLLQQTQVRLKMYIKRTIKALQGVPSVFEKKKEFPLHCLQFGYLLQCSHSGLWHNSLQLIHRKPTSFATTE